MDLSTGSIIAVVATLIALGNFMWNRFWGISGLRKDMGELKGKMGVIKCDTCLSRMEQAEIKLSNLDSVIQAQRIFELPRRITTLETLLGGTNVAQRLAIVETSLAYVTKYVDVMIKQPVHLEKDQLVDRFSAGELNVEEMCRLRDILIEEMEHLVRSKDPKILFYALKVAQIDLKLGDDGLKRCNGKELPNG